MGKDYLKYDTAQMEKTKRVYNDCIEIMNTLQQDMQKMIDNVKESWISEASEEFFKKYNDEWLQGFKQYKEVLEHMAQNLNTAKNKYSEITQQANALKIK